MLIANNILKVQKPKKKNTEWYQKNKKERKVVHTCPHCCYCTTGPRIILTNHIYSKHTEEKIDHFNVRIKVAIGICSKRFIKKTP